jgi:hypothetical protein
MYARRAASSLVTAASMCLIASCGGGDMDTGSHPPPQPAPTLVSDPLGKCLRSGGYKLAPTKGRHDLLISKAGEGHAIVRGFGTPARATRYVEDLDVPATQHGGQVALYATASERLRSHVEACLVGG